MVATADLSGATKGQLVAFVENAQFTATARSRGRKKIADPAKDFLLYETILGEAETARLISYYEEEGGRVWPRMKEHIKEMQAAYGIEIGMFALQTKQEEHLKIIRGQTRPPSSS